MARTVAACQNMIGLGGLRVGTDNATVARKGNQRIKHARNISKQQEAIGTMMRLQPWTKPWAVLKNGGLWQTFRRPIVHRGPESVTISKR